MNKKDYKAIANLLNIFIPEEDAYGRGCEDTRKVIAKKLADYFEKENSIDIIEKDAQPFDKAEFIKDCGVEE